MLMLGISGDRGAVSVVRSLSDDFAEKPETEATLLMSSLRSCDTEQAEVLKRIQRCNQNARNKNTAKGDVGFKIPRKDLERFTTVYLMNCRIMLNLQDIFSCPVCNYI